jgi:hypothetical protein
MASVIKDIRIARPAGEVWSALRDVGALHDRLVPGFVVDTVLEGDTRVVTFADGQVVRERIVGVDDAARRVAYTIVDGLPGLEYHAASAQVSEDPDGGTRFVWIADLLPHALAGSYGEAMDLGLAAVARVFGAAAPHG